MNKRLKHYAFSLMLGMGMLSAIPATSQAEELAISGDVGAFSQYVWRGVAQNNGKTAVQGDLGASYGGLSASVWFSNTYASTAPQFGGRDVVEFDWTVDYSGSVGDLGYSVGGIGYTYLYDSQSNFPEVYAGVSYDGFLSPSLTAYYTVSDSQSKAYKSGDLWVDLGVGTSLAGFDLSGTLSYVKWKKDTVNRAITGGVDKYKSGLSLAAVSISKDLDVSGVTLTPSLSYSMPLAKKQSDGNRYIYGVAATSEFVAGVNFAY